MAAMGLQPLAPSGENGIGLAVKDVYSAFFQMAFHAMLTDTRTCL